MTIRCLPRLTACLFAVAATIRLPADPVTRRVEIDFGRSVPSRNLAGLAARSDGRLVDGPFVTPAAVADLPAVLWRITPAGADRWLLGGGPDGRVLELRQAAGRFEARTVVRLPGAHVFALLPLEGDRFLAGTSPDGALVLVDRGQVLARVVLPADSVFDLAPAGPGAAWIATGNPGRLLRVDLAAFARAGIQEGRTPSDEQLGRAGVTRAAEVRDRNLRRLLVLPDGRILAGSAPAGLVYQFPAAGGPPVILHETSGAEITSLVAGPDGAVYLAAVSGQTPPETRAVVITSPAPAAGGQAAAANPVPASPPAPAAPAHVEFTGRSEVVRLGPGGFAETLVSRNGLALYDLLLRGDQLLLAGGENGELAAYDLRQRLLVTFAGTDASQNTALAPLGPDRVLVLKNNFPGLAILDFSGRAPRTAETARIDLGSPATLGSVGFLQLPGTAGDLRLEYRASNGSDESEGWTPWTPAPRDGVRFDLGRAAARYLKLRLATPAGTPGPFEIGRAVVHAAPQNRPPSLQDFRILPPNLALAPAPEMPAATAQPLAALLAPGQATAPRDAGDAAKSAFLGSLVYPLPGNQLVYWSAADGEGDNLAATLALRAAGSGAWITVAANVTSSHASFSTTDLAEGSYVARLTVAEQAPRPAAERLATTAELDELVVDHTPPVIVAARAEKTATALVVTVQARDALSLLRGAEFQFNHGADAEVTSPVDGVLDARDETFVLEMPLPAVAAATGVTVNVVDAAGNRVSRRLALP